MNILILGGLGFLGRNLTQRLSINYKVFVVDCIDEKIDNYYKLCLTDIEALIDIIVINKIQVVIHLISSIIPSSELEQYFRDVNEIYNPTVSLLNYCAENRVKFMYFSSGGAVYGNQKEIFNECTKREPVSFYGLSKLNFENIIQFYHNTKGLDYLIIRPSNPYGMGQNLYGKQGLIAIIVGKILKNKPIEIWGDGTAVKDYIYIDDFCYYVFCLLCNISAWNNVYNIGSGVGSSVNEVLDAFRENNIKLPPVHFVKSRNSDVKKMILDCTKLQDKVTYKPITLAEGIKRFWEKINKSL